MTDDPNVQLLAAVDGLTARTGHQFRLIRELLAHGAYEPACRRIEVARRWVDTLDPGPEHKR